MLANILIAIGFFGIGTFFGAGWATGLINKCYRKKPLETILLFEKSKKRWEALHDQN